MKAIMISIKPRWCVLIMRGDKTIEVRTSKALASAIQKLIDKYGHADIYGYCSKSNYLGFISKRYVGKVNFKFRCYKVEEIDHWYSIMPGFEQTCLSPQEFDNYIGSEIGYAINISDLEIFDPKELSEFKRCNEKTCIYGKCHKYMHCLKSLTKAPQNFCYVEVE